jgi:hypothetical protein
MLDNKLKKLILLLECVDHHILFEKKPSDTRQKADENQRHHKGIQADSRTKHGNELIIHVEMAQHESAGKEQCDRQRVGDAFGYVEERYASDIGKTHILGNIPPQIREYVHQLENQYKKQNGDKENGDEKLYEH